MKTSIPSLVLVLTLAGLHAAAQESETAATDALELRNKSAFHADPAMHNPFWPIGWQKDQAAPAPVTRGLNTTGLTVTSILLGNPSIAVINGREYEEGQELVLQGNRTGIVVRAIRDGQVVLLSAEGQVVLELQRK